jgi:hypothetical protein
MEVFMYTVLVFVIQLGQYHFVNFFPREIGMEAPNGEERLPDPFEVGDDEELTDEETTPAAPREEAGVTSRSSLHQLIQDQNDIVLNSQIYHTVPPVRPIGTTPSPPPKDDTPRYLTGGVPTLLYPNLFLPIPDVS